MLTIVCPDLSPSAANAAALALGRWAALHEHRRVEIVSLWSGAWAPAFSALGSTWMVNDADGPALHRADDPLDLGGHRSSGGDRSLAVRGDQLVQGAARVLRVAGLSRPSDHVRATALRHVLRRSSGGIWMAGSAAARVLHYVPDGRRVVVHQGAFDPPIDAVISDADDLRVLRARPDAWVAGSAEAAEQLRAAGVGAPIWVSADLVHADTPAPAATTREGLERLAGIPSDAPLVASHGEFDWWDVPDLFVPVAFDLVRRPGTTAHLLWVGGAATERMLWPLRHDLRHAGLLDRVHIAPTSLPAADLLASADVVAITRRGIVSPAQVREIQGLGVPTVRFNRLGEPTGQVGGSTVVPFPDDRAMADAVLTVLSEAGASAAARSDASELRRRHDPTVIAPVLLALLDASGARPGT